MGFHFVHPCCLGLSNFYILIALSPSTWLSSWCSLSCLHPSRNFDASVSTQIYFHSLDVIYKNWFLSSILSSLVQSKPLDFWYQQHPTIVFKGWFMWIIWIFTFYSSICFHPSFPIWFFPRYQILVNNVLLIFVFVTSQAGMVEPRYMKVLSFASRFLRK